MVDDGLAPREDTPAASTVTFRLECGCHVSFDEDGLNEPCLVHEHEGLAPKEAMVVVLRTRLLDESEETAVAFVLAKREETSA